MSAILNLAKKIPSAVRRERLLTDSDPIWNATNNLANENMKLLVEVWDTFIEPHKVTGTCPICLENIRKNFEQMYDSLVQLENDSKLLDAL